MNVRLTRLFLLCLCALSLTACDAEVSIGNRDGSIFDDAGTDASDDDASTEADAGTDAATQSDAGDAGTDASTPPGVSIVPGALAEAVCAALVACDGRQLVTDSLSGEDCETETTERFEAGALSRLADSVADGRVVFDMTRLDECMDAIEAQACNVQSQRRPAACEEAIDGQVALGGDCVINEDCSGTNSFCQAQSECPGRCVALLNVGADCTNSDQCANGFVCAVVSGRRQCVAPGDPGDECGLDSTPLCKRGSSCTPNVGDDDTCKSNSIVYVRQQGQSCDPAAGSYCDRGLACTNTPSGLTCSPIAARDGACFRAQPSQCPEGQYCDAMTGMEGTCRDLPEEGDTCLPSTRSQRCAPGYVCILYTSNNDADDVCTAKVENGDGCLENSECYSNRCDESLSIPVCAPPASLCTL